MEHLISVIISIYNIDKYIPQCIESVLEQTYQPYEILLINDGSTDKSINLCREYEEEFPKLIKIVDKLNGGLSSARNAGLLASGGGYCYFIDGDDYIHPDTLKSFKDVLDKYGELDFVYGRMSFFFDGEDNPELRAQPYFLDNGWAAGVSDGQRALANAYKLQGVLQLGVRGLYNREFLIQNNLLFVEKSIPWGEDEEWTPRVFLHAKRCAGTDKPYYYYREKRSGSETSKFGNVDTAKETIDIYKGWLNLTKENKCTADFREELLKEGGRRYISCLVKFSGALRYQDLQVFLKYAAKNKELLKYSKPKGKGVLAKLYFQAMGIRLGGNGVYLLRKILKR